MTRLAPLRILGLIIALASLCMAVSVSAATNYTDPQGRYSFTAPDGWQAGSLPPGSNIPQDVAPGGIFTAPAPLNGNFNVVAATVPSGISLDTVATQSRAGVAQSVPGYQEIPGGIQRAAIGGQAGARYDYFLTVQGTKLHGAQILALQGTTAYILTFTAAENDFNAVIGQGATILSSFKVGGTGGGSAMLPTTGNPVGAQRMGYETFALLGGGTLLIAGLLLRRRGYAI